MPDQQVKPWWKRWWGVSLIVLVGLMVLGSLLSDDEDENGDGQQSEVAQPQQTEAVDDSPQDDTGTEPSGETTPTPERESSPEPPQDPIQALPTFEPVTASGTGDDVIDLVIPGDALGTMRVTHQGSSNFQVFTYDSNGNKIDTVVNEIGNFEGTFPLNFEDPPVAEVEIIADGPWAVEAHPLSAATRADPSGRSVGRGPAVVLISHLDGSKMKLTHDGESNWVVMAWGESRSLLVNEIGSYEGTVRLPQDALVITIEADGNWTLEVD